MSAAAGAPPPPPPPPPPPLPPSGPAANGNPFDDIPAELLLIIFGYVGTSNLMNLALAIYPTMERHNLSPKLTPATLAHILRLAGRPINLSLYPGPVARMPPELWLYVTHYLEPTDVLSLMFSLGIVFGKTLTTQTRHRLRIWSRRSRRPSRKG